MVRKPEPVNRPAARPLPDPEAWLRRSKDATLPMRHAFANLASAFDPYDVPPHLWQRLSTAYSDMLRHVLAQQGLLRPAPGDTSAGQAGFLRPKK